MAKVFASIVTTVAAGACSAAEQSALGDSATVGKAGSDCGLGAYNVLTGNFNHDKFNTCFTGKLSISGGCSECYATNGEYAAKNCKAACLLGWCKSGCLDCSTAAGPKTALDSCTGFTSGSASPCMEASSTVQCTSDDQAAIQALDDNDFGDKSNKCGKQALSLSGINHDKFKSCMTTEVGISDACGDCYAVTADYGFKNCKAACLLGWCKSGCLTCTAPAQTDLPACTGLSAGSPTPCLEVASTVQCTSDDQAAIQALDDNDFGDKSNKCGKQALSLSGFNNDKFKSCMTTEVGISDACGDCYAVTADYGFKNCKAACLLGWCKSGCLSCTAPAQTDLPACTGLSAGSPTPCLEVASTVQCTSDDQAAIQALDDNDFGDKSNKCGKQALGLSGINHDKFKSCMTTEVGISDACGDCYAVTADYGFKNCKAACLLGWCKSGCLTCTAPAQTDLPACTGLSAGSPTPCLEVASTVQCTSDDQAAIQALDDNDFGDKSNKCGKQALSLSGINHDKFKSCMTTEVGISDACGDCYAVTADYGFKNCKAACLLGWCKSGCLSCTAPAQTDLPACTGLSAGSPTPCLDISV